MDTIIQTSGLRKVYRRRRGDDVVAIEGLDLELGHRGRVHGFLGPNGSGKTTTIRCVLGLIRPSAGGSTVFGIDTARYHEVAGRVGAIVENPKLFPNFSGHRNLSLLAQMAGLPSSEVDRVLGIVGLADRAGDTFASYSLGMKQRLAIAAALLKDPELLILDEPANGLDPAGIAEMRILLRRIADDGKALVVSSHQLAEIELVCDDVTIISRGKLIDSGPLDRIRRHAGPDQVVATIDDRDGAITVLTAAGIPAHPRPAADEILVDIDAERSADVTKALADQGRYLRGLRSDRATLEQAFLNLTGDAPPPPPGPAPTETPATGAAPHTPPAPEGPNAEGSA